MPQKPFFMVAGLVTSAVLMGCGKNAPATDGPVAEKYRSIATLNELMAHVVDPAADIVWGSVSTVIDKNGIDERRPKTDEEWAVVLGGAITLMESGNLLQLDGRRVEESEWADASRALIDAGSTAVRAARARDADAIFVIGEAIYHACVDCHERYMPGAE